MTEKKRLESTDADALPEESEGLWGPAWDAWSPGLNPRSAAPVGSFEPTRYELQVLARHYLEQDAFWNHWWVCMGQAGGDEHRLVEFALRRLYAIEQILAEDEFVAATEPVKTKWKPKFAEVELELAASICRECGSKPSCVAGARYQMERNGGLCYSCQPMSDDS